MTSLLDLVLLDAVSFKKFLNSCDTIITDCDGVLYLLDKLIPGAVETINKLEELDKKVHYLSNNTFTTLDIFHKRLQNYGFQANRDNIVFPTLSIINYLKEKNFTKKAFVLGSTYMIQELQNAGIKVADRGPAEIKETLSSVKEELKIASDIGAVIIDVDINLNYIRLMKASMLLKNPDVLFLVGGTDEKIPAGKDFFFMGPAYFYKMLINFTGRTPLVFGKPSPYAGSHIKDKFCIADPKRVLYIGDSLHQDMSFASQCGFQKLLVLSGLATLKEAQLAELSHRPDYYIKSLSVLKDLLDQYCDNK